MLTTYCSRFSNQVIAGADTQAPSGAPGECGAVNSDALDLGFELEIGWPVESFFFRCEERPQTDTNTSLTDPSPQQQISLAGREDWLRRLERMLPKSQPSQALSLGDASFSADGEVSSRITHVLRGLGDARVIYVTDVEGHWSYFCNWVDITDGISFVKKNENEDLDQRGFRRGELDLKLEDGVHFVYGGDSCDKGPGTLRFVEAMVELKAKYPERVHLILGNRDVNKMRWTAELHESEIQIDRAAATPPAFWLNPPALGYAEYLDKHSLASSKASKLRYMLDTDMGSAGDFEFRRQELAHLTGEAVEAVGDEAVVESYEASVKPGGVMYRYLMSAQLGVLLGTALFVHGQIIGTGFSKAQQAQVHRPRGAPQCADESMAWSVGVVPGVDDWIPDVGEWVKRLNQWSTAQIRDWQEHPTWKVPPTESSYEGWAHRGGAELMAYGTPGTRYPTVVYCRFLDPSSMPLKYPRALVEHLRQSSIEHVVVGHTPHGNAPTVIQHDRLVVVMVGELLGASSSEPMLQGDTSFSHMKSNSAYTGDNRGNAVSTVCIANNECSIKGAAIT